MTSSARFEKHLNKDNLRIQSEKIDMLHLGFDWNEFRKYGMRIFDKDPSTSSAKRTTKNHTNDTDTQKTDKQNKIKNNKKFKALCDEWRSLHNNLPNDNNTDDDDISVHEDCLLEPSQCPCIKRIVFVLNVYHKWCEKNGSDDNNDDDDQLSMVDIIENLPFYSQIDLYNDYCHMLDFHSSKENFWKFIRETFSKCDLTNCKLFMRNHRSRDNFREISKRKQLFFGYDRSDDVINIQFLDRIHAFLLHSNVNIAEENTLYDNVIKNNEKKIEEKLKTFQDFRIKQQKQMEKCQINIANNTKFVTEIEDQKLVKNDDENGLYTCCPYYILRC